MSGQHTGSAEECFLDREVMESYKEVTLSSSEWGIWVARALGERQQDVAPVCFCFCSVETAVSWPFFTTGAQASSDVRSHIGPSSLSLLVDGLHSPSASL